MVGMDRKADFFPFMSWVKQPECWHGNNRGGERRTRLVTARSSDVLTFIPAVLFKNLWVCHSLKGKLLEKH